MSENNETMADLMPTTPDLRAERLAELKQAFPDLFTNEGRLNDDELRRLVDPDGAHETERYEFRWHGKSRSKREAFTPSTATLVYDPDRSVNPDKADGNMIIEAENLEALKLLLCGYRERVKCIYIDPPYNIGKNRVYRDDFSVDRAEYWEETGATEDGVRVETSPETSAHYHSDWLSGMLSRLLLARQLLSDSGVIFVSIDERECANLRRILNEAFGDENQLGTIIWKGATDNNPTRISSVPFAMNETL